MNHERAMNHSGIGTIDSDVWRIYAAQSWSCRLRALLTNRPFMAIFTLRLCQKLAGTPGPTRHLLPLCKILHAIARQYAGMDLPWRTRVGVGLSIQHGWGLVVNADAQIGDNVTLYHGVTIGRVDRLDSDGTRTIGFPVIEDEVWIGPHAIVVGGITVGHGSRIAGGAFVTRDVPPQSLVIGNPARIRRSNARSDVMNRVPAEWVQEKRFTPPTPSNIDRSPA